MSTNYPPWPTTPVPDDPDERERMMIFQHVAEIKKNIVTLEKMIEFDTENALLSPMELKRLDKAVTIIKVGIKIAKKAIRKGRSSVSEDIAA